MGSVGWTFRRREVPKIHAVLWSGFNFAEVQDFLAVHGPRSAQAGVSDTHELYLIATTVRVPVGWWLTVEEDGVLGKGAPGLFVAEFVPCHE